MKSNMRLSAFKAVLIPLLALSAALMLAFAFHAKGAAADSLIGTAGAQIDLSGEGVFSANAEEGWAPASNLGDGLYGWSDPRYQSPALDPDDANITIGADLKEVYELDLVVFVGYQGAATNGLFRDFIVETSLDNVKWTEILSKTDYNEGGQEQAPGANSSLGWGSMGSGDAWTHEFPVRGYGRYVRLRISKIWASADPSNALSLREFALFGRQLEEGQIGGVRFAASSSSEHKDWGDGYGVYALTDNAAAFTGTPRFSFIDVSMPEAPADPDNVDFTLTADLGGAYLVDRFAFYSVNWNQEGKPKQFTVEITADGEQWTQVAEIFGAESGGVVTYTPAYAEGGAGYVQGAAAIDSPNSQQHVVQFPAALAVKVRVHIVKTFPLGENITTAFAEAQVYGTPVFVPAAIAGMPQETVDIALSEQTEYQLSVTVLPASASQEIEYTSADTSIATVDENGLVAFLKAGTVKIRAASKENREIFAETRFSLSEGSVELTSIAFADGTQFEMKQGEKHTFAPVFTPANATDKRVSYSLVNVGGAEAADILGNEGNQVTAMRVGSAKLRVRSLANKDIFADIVVKVVPALPGSIQAGKEMIELRQGGYGKVSVSVLPAGATDKSFTANVAAGGEKKVSVSASSDGVLLSAGQELGETLVTIVSNADDSVKTQFRVKIVPWTALDEEGYGYLDMRGYLQGYDYYEGAHDSETSYNTWYLFENLEKGNKWLECSLSLEHVDWSAGYGAAALIDGVYETTGSNEANRVYSAVGESVAGYPTRVPDEPYLITLKLPSLSSVKGVTLVSQFEQTKNFVTDLQIFTSTDGENFTKALEVTNYEPKADTLLAEFAFAPVEARYVRLSVGKLSEDKTADTFWLTLAEMLVTGKALEEPPEVFVPESIAGLEKTKSADLSAKTVQLSARVLPEEALQGIVWSTSDPQTATVDNNGKVTLKKSGKVTITARSAEDETIYAACELTITDEGEQKPIENGGGCGSAMAASSIAAASVIAAAAGILIRRKKHGDH